MTQLISKKSKALSGVAFIPGDKSISHRSLMFGAMAEGETIISGLLEGEDVLHTAMAMRALGAKISKGDDGLWRTFGVGAKGLSQPAHALEMGNSGTSTRLLMGLVSAYGIETRFTGDASLSKRPMGRVMTPLSAMGATFDAQEGGRPPLTVYGTTSAKGIEYRLPVASAQVKSAILLAGLNADGVTTVIEEKPTRDHTENMLRAFGVEVGVEDLGNGAAAISVAGGQVMEPCAIDVPGDPSSGAFPAAAAVLSEGSEITLSNVGIGARRNGIYLCLQDMGADIEFRNTRVQGGEKTADIVVKGGGGGALKGVTVDPARNASMIDEFPVFAVVAACASGTTTMTDLGELRVKESDRLLLVAEGLKACGVDLEMGEDSLTIHGNGKPPQGGAFIKTELDHRIAMAFLVLGSASEQPVTIDDAAPIRTSFPNFVELMNDLGCVIEEGDDA